MVEAGGGVGARARLRRILVIGVGAGDPEQITLQAIRALNDADVFFVLGKGEAADELRRLREALCDRFITHHRWRFVTVPDPERDRTPDDYLREVEAWHAERARRLGAAIMDELPGDGVGAFLVWGDPSLYDSTLRVLDRVAESGCQFERTVIPGVGSVQALAGRHGVVLHGVGEPVLVTTGRRFARDGAPPEVRNMVVMLDGEHAFLAHRGEGWRVHWGANLGTASEALVAGSLDAVADEIVRRRAAAKAQAGWVMDVYLLSRDP